MSIYDKLGGVIETSSPVETENNMANLLAMKEAMASDSSGDEYLANAVANLDMFAHEQLGMELTAEAIARKKAFGMLTGLQTVRHKKDKEEILDMLHKHEIENGINLIYTSLFASRVNVDNLNSHIKDVELHVENGMGKSYYTEDEDMLNPYERCVVNNNVNLLVEEFNSDKAFEEAVKNIFEDKVIEVEIFEEEIDEEEVPWHTDGSRDGVKTTVVKEVKITPKHKIVKDNYIDPWSMVANGDYEESTLSNISKTGNTLSVSSDDILAVLQGKG